MPKDTIQLNPDKVCLRIAVAGKPIKAHAVDLSEKTIHRIKKGERTSLATAHRLAAILGTTVEDLLLPPGRDEVERQLPHNWLYEGVVPSGELRRHFPAQLAIGGDVDGYVVDRPPSGWQDPLDALLKWHPQGGRKIVLRRAAHAYLVELHYFEYTPDRAQELDFLGASACRFFALARTGDEFRKAALNEFNADWVWSDLRRLAMDRADIVDVEGYVAPAHPRDYVPVARFYRGMIVRRRMDGMRVFGQFHRDFRRALIEYLDGLDPRRVHVSTHGWASRSGSTPCGRRCTPHIGRTTNCASRSTWRGGRRTAAWRPRPGAWSTANASPSRSPSATGRLSIPLACRWATRRTARTTTTRIRRWRPTRTSRRAWPRP
jgi:hypothetical protein